MSKRLEGISQELSNGKLLFYGMGWEVSKQYDQAMFK